MSIEKGCFEIGNITVDRDAPLSWISRLEGYSTYESEDVAFVYTRRPSARFLSLTCSVWFTFIGSRLTCIKLSPYMEGAEHLPYPTKKEQEMKFTAARAALREKYGGPDEEGPCSVLYRFPGGSVCTYMILKGHDRYMGGDIIIDFEENWKRR